MEIDRRFFLAGVGGCLALPVLVSCERVGSKGAVQFVSGKRTPDGRFVASGMDGRGAELLQVPLPGRGHGTALARDGSRFVMFARRPGLFALAVNMDEATNPVRIDALEGRHFYGHGFFSRDGTRLYATENDFENQRGVIGIYDAVNGFARIGEYSTHGTGPHEVALMPDGETLVVANGGIATHPDYPRTKLNVPTMKPSLAYIQCSDGALVGQYSLPQDMHMLSIRHLAVAATGTVVAGMQRQGETGKNLPLLLSHRLEQTDGGLQTMELPTGLNARMKGYCGSVAVDVSGRMLAATSPRGGITVFWDIERNVYVSHLEMDDCCGVAPSGEAGGFIVSAGTGNMAFVNAHAPDRARHLRPSSAGAWDNHMVAG